VPGKAGSGLLYKNFRTTRSRNALWNEIHDAPYRLQVSVDALKGRQILSSVPSFLFSLVSAALFDLRSSVFWC